MRHYEMNVEGNDKFVIPSVNKVKKHHDDSMSRYYMRHIELELHDHIQKSGAFELYF